jgi:hypothetical protein
MRLLFRHTCHVLIIADDFGKTIQNASVRHTEKVHGGWLI